MARLSIRTRIIAVLVLLVGFGAAAQLLGFLATTRSIDDLRERSTILLDLQRHVHQLEDAVRRQHDEVDLYLLSGAPEAPGDYRRAMTEEARLAGQAEDVARQFPAIDRDLALVRAAVSAWRDAYGDRAIALVNAGQQVGTFAPTLQGTGEQAYAAVETAQTRLDADLRALYDANIETFQQAQATQGALFVLSAAGALIVLVIAAGLLTRWITRPLGGLLATAKRAKSGEAVRFASGSDEIGRLGAELERMRTGLYDQTLEAGVVNRFTELTAFVEADADVARATLDALAELAHPDDGAIHISNRSRDRALPEGTIGPVDASIVPLGQLSLCPGVRRSSLYVTGAVDGPLAVRCPLHPASAGTLACIPLVAFGEIIGAVHLHWATVDALPLDIRGAVTRITDHASLAIANRRLMLALQGQASTDGRTGLPNSRTFDEALERQLTARSSFDPLAVLMLDVDHFKQFNDRNGHPGGDQALRVFAGILASSIRDGDMAARYGGEEFAVMLPGASAAEASVVAERIRKRTEEAVIDLSPGHRDSITVSIGIAVCPDDAATRIALLETADAALYRAKRSGRNRWVLAADALTPRAANAAAAEAEIAATQIAAHGGEPLPFQRAG